MFSLTATDTTCDSRSTCKSCFPVYAWIKVVGWFKMTAIAMLIAVSLTMEFPIVCLNVHTRTHIHTDTHTPTRSKQGGKETAKTPLDSRFLPEPFSTLWWWWGGKALHFPLAPPRMFIGQKIISAVISPPLWAAINFSSLGDGPALWAQKFDLL